MSIKEILKQSLPKRLSGSIPSSFDIIGNRDKAVAIIEIPQELKRYKKKIAAAIMLYHKNVRTVMEKGSPRRGVFRTRDYKILAGSSNTEVMHIESGCRFLLDPRKVYFSQREGTERLRVASLVMNNETVMVFFAGVGPFPVVISKKASPCKVIGIEINPVAVKYFSENIKINRCRNVEAVEGDVSKKAKNYAGICDRVVMPLPEKSLGYLKEAFGCVKPGGTVHLYLFASGNDIARIKPQIRKEAKIHGRRISFVGTSKVLPYGPRIWKMRLDLRVV